MVNQDPASSRTAVPQVALKDFHALRTARAFEEIEAQIRAKLANGTLTVGTRLPSERALSEQLGVSRNTLREALRSLENAGLIRLQKGSTGGAFVSEHSDAAIATGLLDMFHLGTIDDVQLTEARIWIEAVVVRVACERATESDIASLNKNIEAAEVASREGNFELRAETNIGFHRLLAHATRNPIMIVVINSVLDVIKHFISRIGSFENSFVLPSRRRFMKHFVAGDADAAVAEMESCLKRLQQNYLSRAVGVKIGEAKRSVTAVKHTRKKAVKKPR